MSKAKAFLTSSVGKKVMMALTGLFLCSFLIVHLYINLFLFKQDGGETFDVYAEFMATYPLLRPMEIVLFAGFLLHAVVGIGLWIANRKVRPQRYKVNKASDNATLTSRIAFWTGMVVAVFLVVHINTFFVQSRFFANGRTMYEIVEEAFRSPLYVGFYIIALVFLGYHLRHGFQSAFQTFGIRHAKFLTLINLVGILFWLVVPAAFAAIPLYFLLAH
ncbi:MAG: succinate dehydrogenase cytochrome b subunit [Bacteroidota bacterium]